MYTKVFVSDRPTQLRFSNFAFFDYCVIFQGNGCSVHSRISIHGELVSELLNVIEQQATYFYSVSQFKRGPLYTKKRLHRNLTCHTVEEWDKVVNHKSAWKLFRISPFCISLVGSFIDPYILPSMFWKLFVSHCRLLMPESCPTHYTPAKIVVHWVYTIEMRTGLVWKLSIGHGPCRQIPAHSQLQCIPVFASTVLWKFQTRRRGRLQRPCDAVSGTVSPIGLYTAGNAGTFARSTRLTLE